MATRVGLDHWMPASCLWYHLSGPLHQQLHAGNESNPAVRPLMTAHLDDLMGDAKRYGLECVSTFHAVWWQQLEHGDITWVDKDTKLKFKRDLIWHQPVATDKTVAAPAPAQKKQMREKLTFNVPATLGMKGCVAYKQGENSNMAPHPKELHVCSFCLVAVNRLCAHQEFYWCRQ